jgi:hypothetical protein
MLSCVDWAASSRWRGRFAEAAVAVVRRGEEVAMSDVIEKPPALRK